MGTATRNLFVIRKYNPKPDYEIIIPAAGLGHRMKYYGPKSLTLITPDIFLLQHQLNMIKKHMRRNPRIILVVGYQAKKIMDIIPNDIVVVENENYETTNVVRSIGMGLRASITNNVVVIYGDLVFNKYALNLNIGEQSQILIDTNNTMTDNEVGCLIQDNELQQLWYDLPNKWAQILYLTGHELELAKQICWSPQYFKMFGFEMINKILSNNGEFKLCKPYKLKINDIDCIKDIESVKNIL